MNNIYKLSIVINFLVVIVVLILLTKGDNHSTDSLEEKDSIVVIDHIEVDSVKYKDVTSSRHAYVLFLRKHFLTVGIEATVNIMPSDSSNVVITGLHFGRGFLDELKYKSNTWASDAYPYGFEYIYIDNGLKGKKHYRAWFSVRKGGRDF